MTAYYDGQQKEMTIGNASEEKVPVMVILDTTNGDHGIKFDEILQLCNALLVDAFSQCFPKDKPLWRSVHAPFPS